MKDSAERAATLLPEEGEFIAEDLNQAPGDVTAECQHHQQSLVAQIQSDICDNAPESGRAPTDGTTVVRPSGSRIDNAVPEACSWKGRSGKGECDFCRGQLAFQLPV